MADIINNIVGGRYYILELIGRGGSAIVYKARDIHNGGIYALKKYITSDPANRKRLLEGMERELEVLKNCTHPVLPKIFDLIKIEDAFFLVMEYIDGIDLKKYVDEYGTLSTEMLVKVMEQVCSGFYLKTAKTYNSVPGSKSLYSFKDYFKTSHKLRKIIKKCTKNNPDLRYQSCIEILCSIKTLHIIGK